MSGTFAEEEIGLRWGMGERKGVGGRPVLSNHTLDHTLSDQVRRGGVVQYVPSTRTGPRRTVRTSTRVCMKRRRGDIGRAS